MSLQTENGMLRAEDVPDVVLEELGSQLLRFAFVFGVIIIACAIFVAHSLGIRGVPQLLPTNSVEFLPDNGSLRLLPTNSTEFLPDSSRLLPEEVDQVGF